MKLAHLACALGRHSVDPSKVRAVHGGQVSRCRHCATPLEQIMPQEWTPLRVRDAGLGGRFLN